MFGANSAYTVVLDSTISGNAGYGVASYSYNYYDYYHLQPGPAVYLQNTLVAGNATADLSGNLVSRGHNLIGNGSFTNGPVNGDVMAVNPMLGPLAYNGGQTLTYALLPGSPAIDAGDDTLAGIGVDQRGSPRLAGAHVDIGAFEVQATVGPPTIFNVVTLPNGACQFDFTNQSGVNFTVLTSTNLATPMNAWTVLGSPTPIGGGVYRFTDSAPNNSAPRYYRLRYP